MLNFIRNTLGGICMKIKRQLSLILATAMMFTSVNINCVFAEDNEQDNAQYEISDNIASDSAITVNNSTDTLSDMDTELGNKISAFSNQYSDVVTYEVEGGYIYFDKESQTIVDCDKSVTKADIPAQIDGVDVIKIGDNAFYLCEKLTEINIPYGVTKLGENAFLSCHGLQYINLPDSLIKLGESSFEECTSLTELKIPANVTSLTKGAIAYCNKLEKLYLPRGLSYIGTEMDGTIGGAINITQFPNLTIYVYKNSYSESYAIENSLNYKVIGTEYPVNGGNIYFDEETGLIVSCDSSLTSVEVPKTINGITVNGIGSYAFENCINLLNVTMFDNITSIGRGAFSYCSKLNNVELSNKISRIEDNLFKECNSLENITIPSSVCYIGDSAFKYCTQLSYIDIPDGVTSIGSFAFNGCYNLTKVVIPESVEKIADKAFSCYDENTPVLYVAKGSYAEKYAQENYFTYNIGDGNIIPEYPDDDDDDDNNNNDDNDDMEYEQPEKIIEYSIDGGILYFDVNNGIITGLDADDYIENLNIPEYIDGTQVKKIGDEAFADCFKIKKVTLPNSIVSIGYKAFYECDIESINLNDNIKSIYEYAFKDCTKLKTIDGLPSHLEYLGISAFAYCQELTDDIVIPKTLSVVSDRAFYEDFKINSLNISTGVTEIDNEAFAGCDKIEYIIIPETVKYIGTSAFSSCNNVKEVDIPKTVEQIGSGAFSSIGDSRYGLTIKTCNLGLQNLIASGSSWLEVTDLELYDDVETIDDFMFFDVNSLNSIKLPDTLRYIGEGAFEYCDNLERIDIPDSVTYIGKRAFYGCNNLKYVTLSSNLRYIMDNTFFWCKNLKSIIIPSSVKSIGYSAFSGCNSLENIVILGKLTAIQDNAFSDCTALNNVRITSCEYIGDKAFYNCSALTSISLPVGLKAIGDSAFVVSDFQSVSHPSSLQSVSLPSSLTSIGNEAFSGCSNLSAITLPVKLTNIGTKAFANCSSLTKLIIPQNVTQIGEYAFNNCTSLTEVNIKSNKLHSFETGVFYGCNNLQTVNIPSSVISIGDSAFRGCALNSVSLSNNVQYIGDYAFNGCDFTELIIPKNLAYIGVGAFSNCKKLTRFTIPKNLTAISDHMFAYCSSLKTLTIPSTVKTIGKNAFASCTSLEDVNLSEGIESIDNEAFSNCSSLKSINIPTTVTTLGKDTLKNSGTESEGLTLKTGNIGLGIVKESDTYITDLILYDEVNTLAQSQFSNCDTLRYVSLPETLLTLPGYAFSGCDNLEKVNIKKGLESIGICSFSGCTKLENINIPDGVITISDSTFSGCSSISSIQIPLSIQSISASAFANCTALSNVYYVGSNDDWSSKSYLSQSGNTYFTNAEKHYNSTSNNGISGDNELELNTADDNNDDGNDNNDELEIVSFSLEIPNYGVIGDVVQCTGGVSTTDEEENIADVADNIVYEISDTSIAEIQKSEALYFDGFDYSRLYADIIAHKAGTVTIKGIAPDGRTAETQITFEPQITLLGTFSNDDGSNEIIVKATLDYADSTYLEKFMSDITYIQSGSLEVTGENVNVAEDGKSATYSILIAPSDYNSYFTISSKGGQTLSTMAKGLKNRYYVPEEYRASSEDVKNAAQDWVSAVNAYTEVLSTELDNAANAEFDNSAIIEEGARKLMEEDSKTNDRYLSFPAGISEEAQLSCYMAFYEAIISAGESNGFDFGTVKTGVFGTISTSSAIVKEIQNSITSITNLKRYTVNSKVYNVELTAFKLNGAYTGKINCYSNKENYLVIVNSPTNVTAGVIVDYIEAVRDLEISAVESVVKGLAQDLKVPSIETLTSAKVTKAIKKHSKLLSSKGFGEIDKFLGDIAGYYKYAKSILKYDKTNFAKDVNNLCEKSYAYLTTDSSTITNTAVKAAYSKVTTAAEKLRSKCYSYLYDNEIDTDNLTFWDKITSFKCPVSISVYNKNDELIGYVDDNELWYSDEIIITRIGDEKKVYSTKDEPIHFEITGTDYGTLNCTFEEFKEGNPVDRSMFYDIALYDGKELSCTLDETDENAGVIYTEDGTIKPDEYINASDYTLVNVNSSSDGNGDTLGSGQYVKGDTVTLIALSDDDYRFAGWYANDNLLSLRSVYNFIAKEDINVTALFVKAQEADDDTFLYGDADNDGILTASDAAYVLQRVLNSNSELPIANATENWMRYTDVDADNILTASDAAYILQKVLNGNSEFPIEATNQTL
jgi:hypothetical protein